MAVGDSINHLENAFRDLVELVLTKSKGETWFENLGLSDDLVKLWEARREEEPKRRPGGEVEQRLLYYAEFHDVIGIIQKNWDSGFKDCFKDKKQFDVYTHRLSDFRNPDAHSRALLPFEEQLVLGMTGELRQSITLFLSSGGGGPEPEHFARIEEIRDSYGTRVTGKAIGGGIANSAAVLRPGDEVPFTGRAWDPEGSAIQWRVYLAARQEFLHHLSGEDIEWSWSVEERDISEQSFISFDIRSARPYSRLGGLDDEGMFFYRVLPRR